MEDKYLQINRVWAMPNKWTFQIKPIKELIDNEKNDGIWIDPFSGTNLNATITNDLNPNSNSMFHIEALEFLKSIDSNYADGVFFDPPYSPRQVKECYNNIGKDTVADNTRADFWSKCKDEIKRILKLNGKAICFGWNSMGIGKNRGFRMDKILLVAHGGNKNDTICTVETKIAM